MSFSRINPGGWGVGAQFLSSQANGLDIQLANALDKTVAGDTLSGVITMGAAANIVASNFGNIQSTVNGGITGSAANSIRSIIAGGIATTTAGGIVLGGGANDWVTFNPATRSKTIAHTAVAFGQMNTGWTAVPFLTGPATTTFQNLYLPVMHNGATLNSVTLYFSVAQAHAGVPQNLISMSIIRGTIANGSATSGGFPTNVRLASIDPQVPTPAPISGAAWYASSNMQQLNYACNQNNVIDNTQYVYYASVTDEHGTNALSGNGFYSLVCLYTAIADMRFAT